MGDFLSFYTDIPVPFQYGFVTLVSLVLGSFASALVWRCPRGAPWKVVRSQCPSCHHKLSVADLVPLLSWLFLRGRCRYCRAPIGWRYPAVELMTLCGGLGFYLSWGWSGALVPLVLLTPFLVALLFIDMEHFILPDELVLATGLLGAVFAFMTGGAGAHAAGMVVYGALAAILGLVMEKILKKPALGGGDVKFFAVAGLWLGLGYLSFFLFLGGTLGVSWGLVHRKITGNPVFPFGPALILSCYVGMTIAGLVANGLPAGLSFLQKIIIL